MDIQQALKWCKENQAVIRFEGDSVRVGFALGLGGTSNSFIKAVEEANKKLIHYKEFIETEESNYECM